MAESFSLFGSPPLGKDNIFTVQVDYVSGPVHHVSLQDAARRSKESEDEEEEEQISKAKQPEIEREFVYLYMLVISFKGDDKNSRGRAEFQKLVNDAHLFHLLDHTLVFNGNCKAVGKCRVFNHGYELLRESAPKLKCTAKFSDTNWTKHLLLYMDEDIQVNISRPTLDNLLKEQKKQRGGDNSTQQQQQQSSGFAIVVVEPKKTEIRFKEKKTKKVEEPENQSSLTSWCVCPMTSVVALNHA